MYPRLVSDNGGKQEIPLVDLALRPIGEMRYTPGTHTYARCTLSTLGLSERTITQIRTWYIPSCERRLLFPSGLQSNPFGMPCTPVFVEFQFRFVFQPRPRALSHPGNIQVAQIVSEARLARAIDHAYKVDVPHYNTRTSLFLEGRSRLFSCLR